MAGMAVVDVATGNLINAIPTSTSKVAPSSTTNTTAGFYGSSSLPVTNDLTLTLVIFSLISLLTL